MSILTIQRICKQHWMKRQVKCGRKCKRFESVRMRSACWLVLQWMKEIHRCRTSSMLGKWFGSMKQLSTGRVRSRQKPFLFVRLALGYIPILLHGNQKNCVYPRTRTWRLTILTNSLMSWQQSAILQAKWWIQTNTGSGDRLVKRLFLQLEELRSCCGHCWRRMFSLTGLMCSHILPPHLTRRLHLQEVSQ